MNPRIVIIGGGPAGCGAAWALHRAGYENWRLYEATDRLGGISGSVTDQQGFTWDYGAHLLFGSNPVFFDFIKEMLGGQILRHQRMNFAFVHGRFIPFPFERNLTMLGTEKCVNCLIDLVRTAPQGPSNFSEYLLEGFGEAICRDYLIPYNEKLWRTPLETMSLDWLRDRVPSPDMRMAVRNVVRRTIDVQWGPNATFRYPQIGGSGAPYQTFAERIENHLTLSERIEDIWNGQLLTEWARSSDSYDLLISTIPLPALVSRIGTSSDAMMTSASALRATNVLAVGFGLERPARLDQLGIYIPDPEICFSRLTHLPYLSPALVPGGDTARFSSILVEVPYNEQYPLPDDPIERCFRDLQSLGQLPVRGREWLLSTWSHYIEPAYPVPLLGRDKHLDHILPLLEAQGIYSVGRFGSWRYELGNMDHSFMAGYSAAQRILGGIAA